MEPNVICPFWFLEAQKLKAQALIDLGFSYLGEEDDFVINAKESLSIECWVVYLIENTIVITYENAVWMAENDKVGLYQDTLTALNHNYQRETLNRYLLEVITGFSSNVERMQPDHIKYALDSVSTWLENHGKQDFVPQLQTVIEGLSHE